MSSAGKRPSDGAFLGSDGTQDATLTGTAAFERAPSRTSTRTRGDNWEACKEVESTAVTRTTGPQASMLSSPAIRGTLLLSRAYARTTDIEEARPRWMSRNRLPEARQLRVV